MASIERECELALINAVSAASVTSYTSEREGGRLLPNLTAKASLTNELLGPFTGVFSLSATLTYTSRADTVSRAGFDHEFSTVVQQLYRSPSLASYMTSNSMLKVYKASINSEAGSIVATNRTWKREISISIQASTRIPDPSLLLHMDGTNGSTSLIDSSLNNFTITPYGAAQISTSQYKFGGASGYFIREDDSYLQIENIELFEFGTNDFTLECWVYPIEENGIGGGTCIARWGGGNNAFFLAVGTNQGLVVYLNDTFISEVFGGTILPDTWSHVCLTRSNGQLRGFINGELIGTAQFSDPITSSNVPLRIGGDVYGNTRFNGYMDEVRIINNYAAYTSNFTPPTQAFPNP